MGRRPRAEPRDHLTNRPPHLPTHSSPLPPRLRLRQQTLPHFQRHLPLARPLQLVTRLLPHPIPLCCILPRLTPPHPYGRADVLAPHLTSSDSESLCFASAHVERVPIAEALEMVGRSGEGFVAYAQQQNDCFRSEYSALGKDCDGDISWATEALGGDLPEAVNLWIGNEFSETSFHKDHYENLYAVVTGEKHFVLLPPTDVHRMYIRDYPAAHYSYSKEDGKFSLELDEPARDVPWCSVNPYPSLEAKDREKSQFPMYFNGPKPFEVTVKAGQILYL